MIIGVFIINKSQVVSRFLNPLSVPKIETLALDFMQNNPSSLYKYISLINNGVYYVLVTSLNFRQVKGQKILSFLIQNSTLDPVDQLVTLDNILYNTVIFPNLSLIKNMESQEEKIYNMMMKNKESEMKKKYSKMATSSKKSSRVDYKDVTSKVSSINLAPSTTINNNNVTKTRNFETSKSSVFILFKERMKCLLDVENNIKNVEINGEMILNIKDESYKNLTLNLKGDSSICKFSPKLDKEACKRNIIRSDNSYSINKNIALMKWKTTTSKSYVSFTFWPSEVKLGTYQVSLEFTAEEDVEDLNIKIPKKKMSDCNTTCNETQDYIEWNVGKVKKGDSDNLDFQCKCNDIVEIFPMEVYFTTDKMNSNVDVEEEMEDCEIRKVMEVEEFKIDYE